MRQVTELSRQTPEKISQSVQELLYLDMNSAGDEFWNPNKTWDGADVCQLLAELLQQHDLVPDKELPIEPTSVDPAKRFVIYDYDADELTTINVYHSYHAAAEDADMLSNAVVVALPIESVALDADEEQEVTDGP